MKNSLVLGEYTKNKTYNEFIENSHGTFYNLFSKFKHFNFIDERKNFLTWEIGFIFNPSFQNQGYATEASRALINYAFRELGAHRVVGFCSRENTASWRVLEKCGMTREGLRRKNAFFRKDKDGRPVWQDSYQYAVLEEDFTY